MGGQNILKFYGSKLDVKVENYKLFYQDKDKEDSIDITIDTSEIYDFTIDKSDFVDVVVDYSDVFDVQLDYSYDDIMDFLSLIPTIDGFTISDNYFLTFEDDTILATEENNRIQFNY